MFIVSCCFPQSECTCKTKETVNAYHVIGNHVTNCHSLSRCQGARINIFWKYLQLISQFWNLLGYVHILCKYKFNLLIHVCFQCCKGFGYCKYWTRIFLCIFQDVISLCCLNCLFDILCQFWWRNVDRIVSLPLLTV